MHVYIHVRVHVYGRKNVKTRVAAVQFHPSRDCQSRVEHTESVQKQRDFIATDRETARARAALFPLFRASDARATAARMSFTAFEVLMFTRREESGCKRAFLWLT